MCPDTRGNGRAMASSGFVNARDFLGLAPGSVECCSTGCCGGTPRWAPSPHTTCFPSPARDAKCVRELRHRSEAIARRFLETAEYDLLGHGRWWFGQMLAERR